MSASTDAQDGGTILSAAWRPAAMLHLACCLAGLAVGIWPQVVRPSTGPWHAAPLPTLQTLGVAQVAFCFLVYPLVLFSRGRRGTMGRWLAQTVAESAVFCVTAVPFYTVAAYLADATVVDAVRTGLAATSLYAVSWSAGLWLLGGGAGRTAAMLLCLAVAVGAPAAGYIAMEFFPSYQSQWIWSLAPATFIWQTAAGRGALSLAGPAWAALLWPALAAAGLLVLLLRRDGKM